MKTRVTLTFGVSKGRQVALIKKVAITISGSSMTTIEDSFPFSAADPPISRDYQVPIGISRTFKADALDESNTVIYSGTTTVQIVANQNNKVTLDLLPVSELSLNSVLFSVPNPPQPLGKVHGFAVGLYGPGQSPKTGSVISESQVRTRLDILAPYCEAIRLYDSRFGIEKAGAIAKSLGLYVIAGVWLSTDTNANIASMNAAITLANEGGADAICVGSECLLRGDVPAGNASSTAGDGTLVGYIKQVKAAVSVPVTYADIPGELANYPAIVDECSFVLAHIYPYWEGRSANQALTHLVESYTNLKNKYPNKEIRIGETGHPTSGNTNGAAVPGNAQASTYLAQVAAWARETNVKVYFFSAYDEKWKIADEGLVGGSWGIWDENNRLKEAYGDLFF